MSWLSRTVSADKPKYESCPAGSHPANLIGVIDLGTQRDSYQGVESDSRKLMLVFELMHEVVAGTTNRHLVSTVVTFSDNPKAKLRMLLEQWRGRKYSPGEDLGLDKALGKPCLVSVNHKEGGEGGTYAVLSGVSALPKGLPPVPPQRTPVARECTSAEPLPDWVPYVYGEDPREVIARSRENRPIRHVSADADDAYPAVSTTPVDCPF